MIEKLQIKNFKSHEETTLRFGNLTLLCGQNGVGKSSIVQSLLLLRQTNQLRRLHEILELNDKLCEIGSADDAMYKDAKDSFIEFQITSAQKNYHWKFKMEDNNSKATYLDVVENKLDDLTLLSLFTSNFQYLSADRLGPQESYPRDDYEVKRNKQISLEKGKGELVAHFLSTYNDKEITISTLINPQNEYLDLMRQTTAWEREISKNINVKIVDNGRNYEIKYNFDVPDGLPTSDFRSENVGFGVSYTLPIIVAILSAEPGSLILIENPEAHLHPYAIAKLTELISLAAQAGIQIIIETHSDHIINGILVQCKRFEKENIGINSNLVKFYYLNMNENTHSTQTTEVEIVSGGRLKNQPDGFFDQFNKDLKTLMRP